jgi:aspartyl-tRNA(Asn)/glutamyl-tRNA(Gln) amidotransferase subunit A
VIAPPRADGRGGEPGAHRPPTMEPAARLAERVAAGAITARTVAEAHLERIGALDGRLGAFLLVDAEGALAQADAVDRARAAGEPLGPLAGVPLGLKDNLVTAGVATTCASRILAGWVPPYDATAVARLRGAGAVLLGKQNMDELGMGSSTESSSVRPTRNPWDLERVPGGSSGGSAAAVAAGLCAAALGSDTGGSVRQPAALCGLVGLKPTYGRVSRHGLCAYASSLDTIGVLARTVEDAALLLEVIAGVDPLDATSIDAPVPRYRDALGAGVAGLTLGVPEAYLEAPGLDPEVRAAVVAALDGLRRLGARVLPITLPDPDDALACYYLIATAEAASNLARLDGVRYGLRVEPPGASLEDLQRATRGAGFGAEVKRRILLGTHVLRAGHREATYRRAQIVRGLIKEGFDDALARCDLVAMPTAPTPAFRLGDKTADPLAMYLADVFTIGPSLAGLPGISIPAGLSAAGLPIGLQLIGRPLGEPDLLRAAAACEAAAPWNDLYPEIA